MLIENGQQPNRTPRHENGSETAELPSDIVHKGSSPRSCRNGCARGQFSSLKDLRPWEPRVLGSEPSPVHELVRGSQSALGKQHAWPSLQVQFRIPGFEYYPSQSQSAPCPLTEYPSKGLVDYQRHSRPTGRPDG
ncbi:predicted protein [Coccidioides posadasii str. Silveira]|uniref:Predicted protein n=1 Tax=Coccidioides posadasii (strain RMSCC 757 / Silveira) TaxID=443226 RepID=E9DFW6_COCPS|nr:predicted protein [Coccidioides posadasii str. Silveira]